MLHTEVNSFLHLEMLPGWRRKEETNITTSMCPPLITAKYNGVRNQ